MLILPFLTQTAEAPETVPLFTPLELGIFGVAGAGLIILLIIIRVRKKRDARRVVKVFNSEATNNQLMRRFYYIISSLPILRPVLRRLESKLKPIYPSDDTQQVREFIKPLVRIVLISLLAWIAVFFFGWGLQPSLYTFLCAIFISYAAGELVSMTIVKSEQTKFKRDFGELVSRIEHYFYGSGNIIQAIQLASGRSGRLMKLHSVDFKKILSAEDVQVQRRVYMDRDKDKYLKLFLSQAEIVKRTGDAKNEHGESIFLSSLNTMVSTMYNDRRRAIEKQYSFAILGWLAAVPCILLPLVADWGVFTMASLTKYYVGRTGNICKLIMLAVSFLLFKVVVVFQDDSGEVPKSILLNKLASFAPVRAMIDAFHNPDSQKVYRIKNIMRKSGDKNNYRVYYLKRILCSAIIAVMTFIMCVFGHIENKDFYVTDTVTLEDVSSGADSNQMKVIYEIVPRYMAGFIESGERPTDAEIYEMILAEPGIKNSDIAADVATEIGSRLQKYDTERFDFYDVVIIILAGVLAFFGPAVVMFARRIVISDRTADEIVQFQTIINMMRTLPGILPIQILQTMEEFSIVYKQSLRECISKYNIDSKGALEELYYKEKEDGFRMLIENFLRIPECGVCKAFEEVESQIENYAKDREQEQKHQLDRITKYALYMSMIPFILLMGYMLIPFGIGTFQSFGDITESMKDIK